jgi:hypothetical protein
MVDFGKDFGLRTAVIGNLKITIGEVIVDLLTPSLSFKIAEKSMPTIKLLPLVSQNTTPYQMNRI